MNFREGEASAPPVLVSRVRAIMVHASLVLFALAIVVRSGQLQILDGRKWSAEALSQQVVQKDVTPPRGPILDANGMMLAETRELMRISVTPKNVLSTKRYKNAPDVLRRQLKQLRVAPEDVKKVFDKRRAWVEIPGEFRPSEVQPLVGLPGITLERVLQRKISAPDGLRRVIGAVDGADVARGGLEQELDSLLRGTVGQSSLVRDPRGIPLETPLLSGVEARPGHTITLTLNKALQEIAEQELAEGMQRTRSSGGDIVILDARDGAILAMAGYRNGKPALATTALTEPYEPGSVIKPLFISYLLDTKKAHASEIINTENGAWLPSFRKKPIVDEHKASAMSVQDVVRFSSNIGAVKLSMRLSHAEEFQVLRDFGFGVPTGVAFPSESRGVLTLPETWSAPTASAFAMGYEMAATPLQIAAAYSVIASGGELLQPSLIKEIRDVDGNVIFRHVRRPVRRVLSREAAAQMRTILASVVDSGTATAARLETFDVAGKSGTARRAVKGHYTGVNFNASFAGMFPAQAPQFVFVARLIDPQGSYFGGVVAAPMINAVLQKAMAARDGSLDHDALAAVAKPIVLKQDSATRLAQERSRMRDADVAARRTLQLAKAEDTVPDSAAVAAVVEPLGAPASVVVTLPVADENKSSGAKGKKKAAPVELRTVPLVFGLNLRDAVRTIHAAGFEVKLGKGLPGRTAPAAGTAARAGSTVLLEYRP